MVAPKQTAQIESIRASLEGMLQEGRSDEALALVVNVLHQLVEDNGRLQARLAQLLKHRFGRRSEKISSEQLRLFLDELAEAVPEALPEQPVLASQTAPAAPAVRLQPRKGRRPLPADLPREEVVLEPAAEEKVCTGCGQAKTLMGHERSEVLEFIPAHFKVLVHARAKYVCRACEEGVSIAPPAAKPIETGLPGFGLIADVLVKKYADHCPLHRMHGIYLRHGVDLAVSTLAGWLAGGSDLLEPIARAIRRKTLNSHVVQTDDTGLRVLDRDAPGGSKRGHIWGYLGDRRWLAFDYTPDWSAEGPATFLINRQGWLQADAYKGYDRLFSDPGSRVVEVGCFAHARRYFVDALETDKRAAVAIAFIKELYQVEADAKARGLGPDEKKQLRAERSRPLLNSLGEWIKKTVPAATPKSPLGQALTYTINQWTALTRFLEDGALEIDNNACERALRQVAVGRKNYLFAGSDEGARRAAIIYTVFGTCRLHDVDPWAYTRDVLEKLAGGWKQSRIDELLPPAWAAEMTPQPDAEPDATAALG